MLCSESRLISRYLNRGCSGVLPVSWEQLPYLVYVTKCDFSATAELKELTWTTPLWENVAFIKPDKIMFAGVYRCSYVQQRPHDRQQEPDGLLWHCCRQRASGQGNLWGETTKYAHGLCFFWAFWRSLTWINEKTTAAVRPAREILLASFFNKGSLKLVKCHNLFTFNLTLRHFVFLLWQLNAEVVPKTAGNQWTMSHMIFIS